MNRIQRVRLVVHGRVQGVFFRDSARRKARELALVGVVRNRRDGTVEIVAEGPAEAVEKMVAWSRIGPPSAVVTDVVVVDEDPTGEFAGFDVAPTV